MTTVTARIVELCSECGRSVDGGPTYAFQGRVYHSGCTTAVRAVASETRRVMRIDQAVCDVIAKGWIPQGYQGIHTTNLAAVRDWWEAGAPLNAWWFAFVSAVQAAYRRLYA